MTPRDANPGRTPRGSRWQSRTTGAVVVVDTVPLMTGHVVVRVVEHPNRGLVGNRRRTRPATLLGDYVRVDARRGVTRPRTHRGPVPQSVREAVSCG